jgi:hypothetical protein
MKLFAVVRIKGQKDYEIVERECYSSKKAFHEDLNANGYSVRKIYNEQEWANL